MNPRPRRRPHRDRATRGGSDDRFVAAVRELLTAPAVQPQSLTSHLDAWIDEDGMTTGRPINTFATELLCSFGSAHSLRGPVVMTGVDRKTGTTESLTSEQITVIRSRLAS